MWVKYFEIITPCGHIYLSLSQVIGIIAVLITIAVLAYSVFAATYSNFLHSSETAWVNWRLSYSPRKVYWHLLAEEYRGGAQRRACSGNLSFYSLCSAIFSLILAIIHWNWLIPFLISVGFIIAAFVILILERIPRCVRTPPCESRSRCIRKLVSILRLRAPLGGHVPQLWEAPLTDERLKKLRQDFWDYTIHDDSEGPIK